MPAQPPFGGGKKPRGPSLRGVIMIDATRGTPRVRKWPKKRRIKKGSKQYEQMEWWFQANRMHKYITAREQIVIMEATKGTPLLPRDLFVMLAASRVYGIASPGNRTAYPTVARKDVSESLDLLGITPGYILVRGVDEWSAVPIPSSGAPAWWFNDQYNFRTTSFNTAGYSLKGFRWTAHESFPCTGFSFYARTLDAQPYRAAIMELDGSNQILDIYKADPFTPTATVERPYFWPCEYDIVEGNTYAIAMWRTTGSPYVGMLLPSSTTAEWWLPTTNLIGVRLRTIDPNVGDTLLDTSVIFTGGISAPIATP